MITFSEIVSSDLTSIIRRGSGYLNRKIQGPQQTHYYSTEYLLVKFKQFNVRKIAILIDGTTNVTELFKIPRISIEGVYTFSLDLVDIDVQGFPVQPLLEDNLPMVDGWIMSSTGPVAYVSLVQFLDQHDLEKQVIFQHGIPFDGAKYYSYIDFFKDDQKTIIYLVNYLDRLYRIPFPLDLRYTLRDLNGNVELAGQILLHSGELRVLSSDELDVPDGFRGYLEVEFEVPTRVKPFLHYWADYINKEGVYSNHQSGLGLHPPNTRFTRGYIPTNSDLTMDVCLFQKDYSRPVIFKALLKYFLDDEELRVERELPPVERRSMAFHDIKEIFSDIDFALVNSPIVEIYADVPIHRPNFYYRRRSAKTYYDVCHAGPSVANTISQSFNGERTFSLELLGKFRKYQCEPFVLNQFIYPPEHNIVSWLGLGDELSYPVQEFCCEFHGFDGQILKKFDCEFNFQEERFFNLNQLLRDQGVQEKSGLLSFYLDPSVQYVPRVASPMMAYQHVHGKYITTTAGHGGSQNLPFFVRGTPSNYVAPDCSAGVTDMFARGISNAEFETFYAIGFATADRRLKNSVECQVEISNESGHRRSVYVTVNPNGSLFMNLSKLLHQMAELRTAHGFYTVWFYCPDANLFLNHLLWRRSDNAISVEHCYIGKFGM